MELRKILLLTALLIVGFMLWEAWMREQAPAQAQIEDTQGIVANSSQSGSSENRVTAPSGSTITATSHSAPLAATSTNTISSNRLIDVTTDVLKVTIDTQGGDVVAVELLDYDRTLNSDEPIQLLDYRDENYYVANSGIIEVGQALNQVEPIQYSTSNRHYDLNNGSDVVTVSLTGQSNGLAIERRYQFHRNSYNIKVDTIIDNRRNDIWQGFIFSELKRKQINQKKGLFVLPTYVGAAISTQEKPYQKIKFKKMREENVDRQTVGGWAAMIQQYFVSAWIPEQDQLNRYYSYVSSPEIYTIGLMGNELTVQPGHSLTTTQSLYVGPEISEQLKMAAPHLELTIDYGFLWPISTAIFWAMKHIYNYVGNWGWSILIITLIIKLLFYHLSATSYRSMARMRQLTPKIQAIRERYADDKQKLGQATMEVYRKEKVNPLGGCLPILVQIPVFIALYWVLIESVELRHAPFIWWIQDLTVRDPYFILPLIMGLTMFIQQKLSPMPPDPMQAKIMMLMPIVFTVFFMTFPAGLVLYWTANNALSVLQQWHITRKIEMQSKTAKHKK